MASPDPTDIAKWTIPALLGSAGLLGAIKWWWENRRPNISLANTIQPLYEGFGDPYTGPPCYWYHLKVTNRSKRVAGNVYVQLVRADKSRADGSFSKTELAGPVKLLWAQGPNRVSKDIVGLADETCNLGYAMQRNNFFQLDVVHEAQLAPRFILYANERMQIQVIAIGDNAKSKPLNLEITWDGMWSDKPEDMCVVQQAA